MSLLKKNLNIEFLKKLIVSFWVIFFIGFTNHKLFSQSIKYGAVSNSMGGSYVCLTDFWSSISNQGGLALIEEPAISVGYNNDFLIKELSTKYIGVALPIKQAGVFGLSFNQFGFNLFNQNKLGLAYSMMFNDKLSGGVQIDYFNTRIADGYGNKSIFTFEAGVIYKLNKKWILGTHLFNPVMVDVDDYYDDRLNTGLSTGFSFLASEQIMFSAEIEKLIDKKPSVKSGVDYIILDFLNIRCGMSTNPNIISMGFGLNISDFKIDLAGSYSQILGFNPSTTIIYRFNK